MNIPEKNGVSGAGTEDVLSAPPLDARRRARAMRDVILAQCAGCLALVAFRYGLMLLLLSARGFGGATIVICLVLPPAMRGLLTIPGAYFADRYGKKLVGMLG